MRTLLVIAGLATTALGFAADAALDDPALLQGALTLGGGWLICAIFSLFSRWHGIIGGGILALLAAARCVPALPGLFDGDRPAAPYQATALGIAVVVLAATLRAILAERTRRQRENFLSRDRHQGG